MKVYVVMKGYYSGRHIAAVTLDKEKAQLLQERFDDGDVAEIEEYDTDNVDDAYEAYKLGYNLYFVGFDDRDKIYLLCEDKSINGEKEQHNWDTHRYYVWAKDEKTAKRIAIDRHAMWKAQQEGIS